MISCMHVGGRSEELTIEEEMNPIELFRRVIDAMFHTKTVILETQVQ